jgi:hypothetical protein
MPYASINHICQPHWSTACCRFDDDIAHIISSSAKRSGLTFAPEAGTQRLRDIINKGLTNEELLRGVKTAWDKGWKQARCPPPLCATTIHSGPRWLSYFAITESACKFHS